MIMLGTTKPKFDSHLVFHICLLQFVKMSEKGRIIRRLSVFGRLIVLGREKDHRNTRATNLFQRSLLFICMHRGLSKAFKLTSIREKECRGRMRPSDYATFWFEDVQIHCRNLGIL